MKFDLRDKYLAIYSRCNIKIMTLSDAVKEPLIVCDYTIDKDKDDEIYESICDLVLDSQHRDAIEFD